VALSLRARQKDAFGDVAVDQKAKLDIVVNGGLKVGHWAAQNQAT